MARVGTNVVFENDKIKVWEFNLEPGEQTPVHTHDLDYIFYVINGTTLEVFDADNKYLSKFEVADGDVVPLRMEGDELVVIGNESQRIPATHSARNGGPNRYREILVETK
ncbi:MAG: putative metal-dependent enzyme (double-stranded beta helix superfamily) [Gammaproteobacteria bacterium]|jgi:predicted metal-dependent enzyme (double-stranded beta helix superfamily)